VPLSVTLLRLTPATQWRDDLAICRGLGLVPVGGEGVVSTVFMQIASLAPIGGRFARASVGSALGLGAAGVLLFSFGRRLLLANAKTPIFGPCLALAGALLATLAPTWQLEGTLAGGATLGTAMAFGAALIRSAPGPLGARPWLAQGALVALAAVENRHAGLMALVMVAAQALLLLDLPSRRVAALTAGSALLLMVLLLLPIVGRSLHADSWVGSGWTNPLTLLRSGPSAGTFSAVVAWLGDLGVVSLVLATLGGVWGFTRARLRWLSVPWVTPLLLDWALRPGGAVLSAESAMVVRLAALGVLSVFGALGVHTAVLALSRANIPFARPAKVLLVVFFSTLVMLTAEDSSYIADRRHRYAADVWTDEALAALPWRTLLLVRSEAIAWRLWAARVVRGERPDVLVVPLGLLEETRFARHLIEGEPVVTTLVRDVAARGHPTEYALSSLADARPLVVELDPAWDQRLLEHLLPEPFWLGFSPHPLGRSDRRAALEGGRESFRRVVAVATAPLAGDPSTARVLANQARAQAAVLAALGEREGLTPVLEDLKQLDPEGPFMAELQRRLAQRKRGPIELDGLVD
jgi:hypothetical protein